MDGYFAQAMEVSSSLGPSRAKAIYGELVPDASAVEHKIHDIPRDQATGEAGVAILVGDEP